MDQNPKDCIQGEYDDELQEKLERASCMTGEIVNEGHVEGNNVDIAANKGKSNGTSISLCYSSHGNAFRSKKNTMDSGEDGYCIQPLSDGRLLMAVADGVGSWRDRGVDPSVFPNSLLLRIIEEATKDEGVQLPKDILSSAFSRLVAMNSSGEIFTPGSSTACVAIVHPDCLKLANLGDSGVLIIREGLILFRSQPQQASHNCPFQISIDPQKNRNEDWTAYADTYSISLRRGDVIIMATDGLFDNVFDDDINWLVGDNRDAQELADNLLVIAQSHAFSEDIHTPYSAEVNRHYPHYEGGFMGGKKDDITILVCVI